MEKLIVNIDIETIPPGELENYEMKKSPPKTIKKPEKIAEWIAENTEKAFRDQGKNPTTLQILVIGFTMESESDLEKDIEPEPIALCGENEEEVLRRFEEMLKEELVDTFDEGEEREIMRDIRWVGYNIRKFDLEAIWLKAIKYKLFFLAKLIQRSRFDKSVYDLMEKIQGPRSMEFISFDTALKLFDLGGKTDGVDGSMVYDLYLEGKMESVIVPYCIDDIMSNRELYKRIKKGILE